MRCSLCVRSRDGGRLHPSGATPTLHLSVRPWDQPDLPGMPMNPVMYLVSSPRVPMSKGKFGAQAAHAAVEAYKLSPDNWLKHCWDERGKQYAKVVLMADDLDLAAEYIHARGFDVVKIIDEGRTEFDKDLTLTFLGVQIVDKDNVHVKATFEAFKLYREPEMEDPGFIVMEDQVERSVFDRIRERFNGNTAQRDSGTP